MNPKIEEILKALRFEASIYVGSSTSTVCEAAADLITELQQELIDERYRHDRYADFCVAQGEELSKLKNDIVRCKDCDRRGEEGCPMRFWEATVIKHDGLKWSDYEFKDQTEDNGFCHMGVQKREVKTND